MPTPEQTLAETERQEFIDNFRALLDRPEFRAWLLHVIDSPEWCKAHGLSADFDSDRRTFFTEGRRSVGLALMVSAQALAPKMFMRALNETMGLRNNHAASQPINASSSQP